MEMRLCAQVRPVGVPAESAVNELSLKWWWSNVDNQVMVSVVCTCFNKRDWIRQALDSVVAQKAGFRIEIIIVDDASTDGSAAVIESFRSEHPDIVRVITHEANRGISATWIEACRAASGRYIARVDGDDYWTDETKLQAQVDVLSKSDDSKWCSTDFDMVEMDGAPLCEHALEAGFVATVDSYEQMLAIKGLTNSSTWLVDAQLMNEVNSSLDPGAADDTFSLQLDLFKRTRLSRIMKSMCAMRINAGSDSRPQTEDGARRRFDGLKRQQLHFLAKYPDADYREIARHLIERDAEAEVRIFNLDKEVVRLRHEVAERDATIGRLQAEVQGYRNSRNFLRPMKNAAKSIVGKWG